MEHANELAKVNVCTLQLIVIYRQKKILTKTSQDIFSRLEKDPDKKIEKRNDQNHQRSWSTESIKWNPCKSFKIVKQTKSKTN